MQKRKIAIIGLLVVFAIVLASSANAIDLGFLTGNSGEDVSIGGLDFHIPDGYTNNETLNIENVTETNGNVTSTLNGKAYENSAGDSLAIFIAEYDNLEINDTMISAMGGAKKTIKNHEGYMVEDGNFTDFVYQNDGKLVSISVSDSKLLEEIII